MEDYQEIRMPLIGDMAPAFHAVTTQGEIDFPQDYNGRWVVLFSYPTDFTPVCTTEIMTFASMMNEFKELDTELIGLSIDSIYSHIAWLRKIRELTWKDIKHVNVTFPLIADLTLEIAKKYGMVHPGNSKEEAVRAVFIIDPEGKVRALLYYPSSTGRNIEEIKRLVIALQLVEHETVVTPADWQPCDDVVLPPPETCSIAKERVERVNENIYCLDWFLSFQQSNCVACKQEPEAVPYPSAFHTKNKYDYRK